MMQVWLRSIGFRFALDLAMLLAVICYLTYAFVVLTPQFVEYEEQFEQLGTMISTN